MTTSLMYRSTPPMFDDTEIPSVRRVKPLPKRRRTYAEPAEAPGPEGDTVVVSMPMPHPDATAEELLAHTKSIAAQIAQSYYAPMFNDAQGEDDDPPDGNAKKQISADELAARLASSPSMVAGFAGPREAIYGDGLDEEDDRGDGDYADNLAQRGNTKKRKVPAHMTSSPRGQDSGSNHSGAEDDLSDRHSGGSGAERDTTESVPSPVPPGGASARNRRTKMSAATLAGLHHKEMLESRKRQLAAVLGALSLGDSLALDQALSAQYPFAQSAYDDIKQAVVPPRVRLSQRKGARLSRMAKAAMKLRHPDSVPLPACEFTYSCPSATAERLISTKGEVAMLRKRFAAELARQATKAAKLAAAESRKNSTSMKATAPTRTERAQRRARTTASVDEKGGNEAAEFLLNGPKPRKPKKKKRSTLANASNPHHLRNYVPSRLPNSGPLNPNNATQQTGLGPFPLRFLAADLPPSRRKKAQPATAAPAPVSPAEEWICAFCEYELFYGDENEYRRALRNRKKILKRRRRARERAAAAASGVRPKASEKASSLSDDYDEAEFDPSMPPEFSNSTNPRFASWKGDPNKPVE
ncbi:hypothetical protein HGRIS_004094 [Hohenbuehelia grisea]|uniref:Uncharacterized protein n=1 Tax=Hohenbuehelia grisea TaxID=104357 RepID=A0ABR3JIF9_9AGAR